MIVPRSLGTILGMIKHISPDNTSMHLAIDELRKTARSSSDIEYWIQENLTLFGFSPPSSKQDAMVSIGYSFLDVLDYYDLDSPIIRSHVQVSVDYRDSEATELDKLLSVVAIEKSEHFRKFDMDLNFNDWPFLTANLAMAKLNDHFDISKNESALLEDILHKYVPLHFPTYTWEGLSALHAADLLAIDDNIGRLDVHAFVDMLFSSRSNQAVDTLPDTNYTTSHD